MAPLEEHLQVRAPGVPSLYLAAEQTAHAEQPDDQDLNQEKSLGDPYNALPSFSLLCEPPRCLFGPCNQGLWVQFVGMHHQRNSSSSDPLSVVSKEKCLDNRNDHTSRRGAGLYTKIKVVHHVVIIYHHCAHYCLQGYDS